MDNQAVAATTRVFPVSVKGVVVQAGRVLLVHNERQEWELPGGKLEAGETLETCVAREIAEETGWTVSVGPILDAWLYRVLQDRDVLIVTYGCTTSSTERPVASHEHSAAGLFPEVEVAGLNMPGGYKRSIASWFEWLRRDGSQPC